MNQYLELLWGQSTQVVRQVGLKAAGDKGARGITTGKVVVAATLRLRGMWCEETWSERTKEWYDQVNTYRTVIRAAPGYVKNVTAVEVEE